MKDIDFKYVFDEKYNPQYVNGAFGGTGPQGEVIIHFYVERGAIPYQVSHEIGEDGHLSESVKVKPEDFDQKFIRFIQSGIILDKKHAVDVYKWLGKILGENNEE